MKEINIPFSFKYKIAEPMTMSTPPRRLTPIGGHIKVLFQKRRVSLSNSRDRAVGENLLFNTEHMTEEDIVELENALQNDPRFEGGNRFVPPIRQQLVPVTCPYGSYA